MKISPIATTPHNVFTMNTPPRQPPKGEWTTPTRTRVLTLLETGLSQSEVAHETNVPRSTVSRWSRVLRARRTSSKTGRPRQLTKHDIRRLIGRLRSGWEGRKLYYRRLGQEVGLSVSPRTIERALSRQGYLRCKACKKPFISWENQKQRKTYGEDHWQKPVEFWQKHMCADECIFDTSKRGSTCYNRGLVG